LSKEEFVNEILIVYSLLIASHCGEISYPVSVKGPGSGSLAWLPVRLTSILHSQKKNS